MPRRASPERTWRDTTLSAATTRSAKACEVTSGGSPPGSIASAMSLPS
jgi:hypothetical protein